jgi:ATP-dependent DNA helicase RecQ
MKGNRNVRLRLPPERTRAAPRARAAAPVAATECHEALFQALRAHRLALAREAGVAPYVIASDRSLRDLAAQQPRDLGQLLEVYGFGQTRAERYGGGFLAVIAGYLRG